MAPMEVSKIYVQFLKDHPFTACLCEGTRDLYNPFFSKDDGLFFRF